MITLPKIPRTLLSAPGPGKARAHLYTAHAMLAKRPGVPNDNPEIPGFRVGDIVSTRRGRIVFYSLFALLATVESLTWFNFAPRVFGSGKTDGE